MKIDRKKVFDKYKGHCAYCGEKITKEAFQVDHIHPKKRSHWNPDLNENRFENLNPSCRKCNLFKAAFDLEVFRREISYQVTRLKKNAQFMRALVFGQITIQESPIVFYFERFEGGSNESGF